MMELPEAVTIAGQFNAELRGRRIASAERENSPHKWVFYNRPREDYERILPGRTIGESHAEGSHVNTRLTGGLTLQLGDGGERILLHADDAGLPRKYHLLLRFEDGCVLTVSVQGWGAVRLFDKGQLRKWLDREPAGISPISEEFTYDRFKRIVAAYAAECDKPVKAFLVNRPQIRGIGNGYLQDILFGAGIHPRRKVRGIAAGEQRKLYRAIREVLAEAIAKGGRDDELDLFGRPGRYVRQLDRRANGKPCPRCGMTIEKIQFLGGACYFCPTCQPET
jgi:formamidopyrimidine-DNA glycosylase